MRLPDIDRIDRIPGYLSDYGRCAILNSGNFWFGGVHSSHPGSTYAGFYWAVENDTLYFSPRGAVWRWEEYITGALIRFVIKKAGFKGDFND